MGTVLFFGPYTPELQQCFQIIGSRGEEVIWEQREGRLLNFLKNRQPSLVISGSALDETDCQALTTIVEEHSPHTATIVVTPGGMCPHAYRLGPILESGCPAHHTTPEALLLTTEKLLFGEPTIPSSGVESLFTRTSSECMKQLEKLVTQIIDTDATVLLQGESGVGKGVVASYLHVFSPRKEKPFIKINCAALPGELLESELFGYERGAFTGAQNAKPGKFECANGGTILLDEIGDLPLHMQAKLLHVLEDNHFSRLGSSQDIHVNVRVIVATNRDLEGAVKAGKFRKDLYYRLKVMSLLIPPLRERVQDIHGLVNYFVEKFSRQFQRSKMVFASEIWRKLEHYAWPGNVRELENLMKRVVILQDSRIIEQELKSVEVNGHVMNRPLAYSGGLKEISRRASREAEREVILNTLQQTHWNRTLTAKILQISYKALLYKIQEMGLSDLRADVLENEIFN
ncbi:MAG: sigma-54-dependent Fis family transcriptional regulator [Nitrospira sp.]|nr:sigma-54-dependent Fis family transcriptional regulator [Nitrospira sp.]